MKMGKEILSYAMNDFNKKYFKNRVMPNCKSSNIQEIMPKLLKKY